MDRRGFVMGLGAATVAAIGARAALAEAPVDAVVRQLEGFGYRSIRISRTLLGRVRITGRRRGATREIVLDPRTGEILRDLILESGGGRMPELRDDNGSGSGSFGGDRDDDSETDDSGSDDDSHDDSSDSDDEADDSSDDD